MSFIFVNHSLNVLYIQLMFLQWLYILYIHLIPFLTKSEIEPAKTWNLLTKGHSEHFVLLLLCPSSISMDCNGSLPIHLRTLLKNALQSCAVLLVKQFHCSIASVVSHKSSSADDSCPVINDFSSMLAQNGKQKSSFMTSENSRSQISLTTGYNFVTALFKVKDMGCRKIIPMR